MKPEIKGAAGVILVGGKGKRMGRSKWDLPLCGKSLLSRTLRVIHPLFSEVIVVKRAEQELESELSRVKMVNDNPEFPVSALRGLYSGMKNSEEEWVFLCGCDMPFIQAELVQFLFSFRGSNSAVIPVLRDGPHPLHAFYHRSLLDSVEENLRQGIFRIMELSKTVRVRRVKAEEIETANYDGHSFFNINTPPDLKYAEEFLQSRGDVCG